MSNIWLGLVHSSKYSLQGFDQLLDPNCYLCDTESSYVDIEPSWVRFSPAEDRNRFNFCARSLFVVSSAGTRLLTYVQALGRTRYLLD